MLPRSRRRTHTRACTFPAQIWESSTSGALTFHSEVKGGGGVCVEEGRGEKERQKEDLYCFRQLAGEEKSKGKGLFFAYCVALCDSCRLLV